MASPTGGRFIVGPPTGFPAVTLALNNGSGPSQSAVTGNFNIEVFTAAGLTSLPTLDSGFQAGILDPNGTVVAQGTGGALTGTNLALFSGNYAITDSVTGNVLQTAASVILGSGNQSIVGAPGDTIQGGSGSQVINAVTNFAGGAETVLGGSGPTTVFGGPGDSVVAGSGSTYVDGTAGKMVIGVGSGGTDTIVGTSAPNSQTGTTAGPDTINGGSAAVNIQGLGKGDVINFGNQTGTATINATVGNVGATLGGGIASVYGGVGDTINLGSVGQLALGGPGKMTITDGSAGVDSVYGSSVAGGLDTILGGNAALNFDPQAGGGGDLINLSGSSASATVNAFSFGGVDVANVNDTVMAGTGSDSVWGGQGDRIGVGTSSSAGGSHTFFHSTSIAGAAVAFGTNDSVGSSSSARATVTNFNSVTDTVFYASRATSNVDSSIVASSSSNSSGTTITLPDGTTMFFAGVASASLLKFTS